MSEADIQPSSFELNSVAKRLEAAGIPKTSIAQAVVELVREYLGIHTNMSHKLARAL